MARFNFRLQQYLGVKEQMETQKELEYAKALRKVEEEKQLLRELHANREAQIADFQQKVLNNIDTIEIKLLNDSIERLKQYIKKQEERVKAAEEFAEIKRQELVEAMKERKALEIVRDNAREAFNLEQNLVEQKQVDELVSFKYKNAQAQRSG
ncbi:MAG: flagellar export protein FliJ [Defluviitaleaceae bacterium]|nr:flagellar export protein FliJ [Defluviitaleaceae bacterium]MCL2275305.1 flagellar export protein FliJ [Defluviitaleaceae bacterium]